MGRNAYCMRFRPVPSEGESFMASKQKILIVDDDNNIAELISLYLTKECYDTKIVNDGEEAVREFHSFQPNLILLDLMLPRNPARFRCSDHHALGKGRGVRQSPRPGARRG